MKEAEASAFLAVPLQDDSFVSLYDSHRVLKMLTYLSASFWCSSSMTECPTDCNSRNGNNCWLPKQVLALNLNVVQSRYHILKDWP